MARKKVIVVGSGNAALCAGIAALEEGADTLILERATAEEAGGNSRYTAGAMRFAYQNDVDLLPLLSDPQDERLRATEFGSYPVEKFTADLEGFNDGEPLNFLQKTLVARSYETMVWLHDHNIQFDPIYSRQSFCKDDKYIFWGGLTLEARGEGVGLVDAELQEFSRLGGAIQYQADCVELLTHEAGVTGIRCLTPAGQRDFECDAIVLGCGGFEANASLRRHYLGEEWVRAKVRGSRHNTGAGIEMALACGAAMYGRMDGCHAVPMDLNMPDYGNANLPFVDRKNYRKICYFLGIMLNSSGKRFVDEGLNFRNYTYAQFGRAVLNQQDGFAWQIFDSKVDHLLYDEYRFEHASFVEASTLEDLARKLEGVDTANALQTIKKFGASVDDTVPFDPTVLDGRCTHGLKVNKSNWANRLDKPPYRAYPVTCGITFTYAGLKIDESAAVLNVEGDRIPGLYTCGELVGGVFFDGYSGGSGLTSGAVFGRIAGRSAGRR